MFVSRSMTRQVITTDPDARIFDAQELMHANDIRHLPVVEKGNKLVGIVTDRDIRSALPYSFFKKNLDAAEKEKIAELRVKDIMSPNPISVSPTSPAGCRAIGSARGGRR